MSNILKDAFCISTVGDSALRLSARGRRPWTAQQSATIATRLRESQLPGTVDVVAAFDRVTLYYDAPLAASDRAFLSRLREQIELALSRVDSASAAFEAQIIEIPVDYSLDVALDLSRLAKERGLTPLEFAQAHSAITYEVLAIGFGPGFAYLGGLPKKLCADRLATPRLRVPAGSIAIGGTYTGIYPTQSPGGWNIIGRTDSRLFDLEQSPPARLQVGQRVRFLPQREAR